VAPAFPKECAMNKPRLIVCVLCGTERGGWVNPWLTQNLLTMSQEKRYDVQAEMVVDKYPVDYARNCAVALARERKAHWLFMVDNDQSFWPEYNALDVLAGAGIDKDIIGIPTMQGGFNIENCDNGKAPLVPNFRTLDQAESDGEFFTVNRIGGAAIFLNHRVWEKVPGPWFKWCYREDSELHETDGSRSEDFYFCELVQRHGFKVWAHRRMIPHWKTTELTKAGMYFEVCRQAAARANVPMPAGPVKWGAR
jgi:hypothetical protein